MAVEIFTSFLQITDSNLDIVSGAEVNVYAVNSTTPLTVYSDATLSTVAANPIICDSAARHDMRYIVANSYKVVIKRTGAGATILTRDYIDGRVPLGSGALPIANGGTGATNGAAALSNLGGATAAELADVSAQVAAIAGTIASTEKTHIATGSTAQRPASPLEGDVRRNTTTHRYEGYNNSAAWEQFFTDTEVASSAEALAGTDNTKVMTPARVRTANAFQSSLLHVRDEKAANTAGGTFTSGSYQTRVLNTTLTNEISGASLGSNQITLPTGTYFIEASAPFNGAASPCTIKLRNTTDGSDALIGHAGNVATGEIGRCNVSGRFTIASQKVFELQHRCTSTKATDGLGIAANLGVVEVYGEVLIWKVA